MSRTENKARPQSFNNLLVTVTAAQTTMAPAVAATEPVSGHGAGLEKKPKVPAQAGKAEDETLVLNTIRCLAADLCQQVRLSPQSALG